MSEKKVIAIVGATGAQGGGLVKAILADRDGEFAVRALTRDATSERAQELVKLGAEVVEADNYDADSLVKAFAGAYGAFLVTNFWAHMSAEKELREAANLAEAAQQAGLRHVIWSTLEDTRDHIPVHDDRMPTLQGRYKVPHFDAKAEADALFTRAGVPTTFLRTTFYWENLASGWGAARDADIPERRLDDHPVSCPHRGRLQRHHRGVGPGGAGEIDLPVRTDLEEAVHTVVGDVEEHTYPDVDAEGLELGQVRQRPGLRRGCAVRRVPGRRGGGRPAARRRGGRRNQCGRRVSGWRSGRGWRGRRRGRVVAAGAECDGDDAGCFEDDETLKVHGGSSRRPASEDRCLSTDILTTTAEELGPAPHGPGRPAADR
jgi:hypothetical protein